MRKLAGILCIVVFALCPILFASVHHYALTPMDPEGIATTCSCLLTMAGLVLVGAFLIDRNAFDKLEP
jgi:hypothetical protein